MNTTTSVPSTPSVNGSFIASGLLGVGGWHFWPNASSGFDSYVLAGLCAGASVLSAAGGLSALCKNIRVRKRLIESEAVSTEHGSAREATLDEILARGCANPNAGAFLGLKDENPVFVPKGAPFTLIEGPPGSGKDIYLTIGDILHHSLRGVSTFAPDVKCELGPMLARSLRSANVETWCINPTGKSLDVCENVEVGLYDALIKSVHAADETRRNAIGIADQIAKLHLPDKDADKSKLYFIGGSRRLIRIVALSLAIIDPANCNPASVLLILNDVKQLVARLRAILTHLDPLTEHDGIVADLKSEAKNLLHRYETNPENFGSFLEWATQSLAPYNQAGFLSTYGSAATNDIADLTARPITAIPMTPLSHAGEFESFTSIINANLILACKLNPRRQRVHLVCNEMLNYRFASIASDLETMRGLGMTATFYVQSFSGLIRQYGKETAASINDYCDVKIYFGINSFERAKYVSDMLSEATINAKDYSYKSSPDDVNISCKRHARRLMTPDEIMAMPYNQAWVFIKGIRPFRIDLIHYGHVSPWNSMVAENPLEGAPLSGKTLLELDYRMES